jgi:hypothetical protein
MLDRMTRRFAVVLVSSLALAVGAAGLAEAGGGGGISGCGPTGCSIFPSLVKYQIDNAGAVPLTSATFSLLPGISLAPATLGTLQPVVVDLQFSPREVTLAGIDKAVLTANASHTAFTWTFTGFDPGDAFSFKFDADGDPLFDILFAGGHAGVDLTLAPGGVLSFDPVTTPDISGAPGPDHIVGPRVKSLGGITVTETTQVEGILVCPKDEDCVLPPELALPACFGPGCIAAVPAPGSLILLALGGATAVASALGGLGARRRRGPRRTSARA